MAEPATIARPYAKAAFGIAHASGRLAEWGEALDAAASAAAIPEFRALLGNPAVETGTVADLLVEFAGGDVDAECGHFFRLLAERRRVALLPAIHEQYETLRADAEKRAVVEVTSAVKLDDAQRERLIDALKARLGLDVDLNERTDASILGGAVIRAGDMVIDGSVRGRLDKLAATLAR